MALTSKKQSLSSSDGKNKRTHSSAFQDEEGSKESVQDTFDPMFWGPYLSERQWGTVREDCSSDGSCWDYLKYEDAVSRAYKWGEDGLLGVCDKFGVLCASVALWNGKDKILKERLFGLNGNEGNHGEDVKELYYYLDNTPTHNYMHALYKYPLNEFPYDALRDNDNSLNEPEFEILNTGVFDNNEYCDIHVEYAKPASDVLLCKYSVVNKSSNMATLDIIPQFYFRNTSVQSDAPREGNVSPNFQYLDDNSVSAIYDAGMFNINFTKSENVTLREVLFTNNETMTEQQTSDRKKNLGGEMFGTSKSNYKKDAFHRYILKNDEYAIREEREGTKCGAWMTCDLPPYGKSYIYWQIAPGEMKVKMKIRRLDHAFDVQRKNAEEFYQMVIPKGISADQANICQQAVAGLLWSKQLYIYNCKIKSDELQELHGEEYQESKQGKSLLEWSHLNCHDIILMPDKWEFPWFAAWDLAVHCVLFASIDIPFAMEQLKLLLSDNYMRRNGQIPGCEFDLGDPNPPITAWAVWMLHQREKAWNMDFIKSCYLRLVMSYQWWHMMDKTSCHLYGNGFLGMDNISVFNRSNPPDGVHTVMQADATGWMGFFALNMLQITLEQCKHDICVTDMAIRFLKDFLAIAKAINKPIKDGGLWDEEDHFYYDVVHFHNETRKPICVRSWTGIIPLFACAKVNLRHSPLVKSFLLKCDCSFAPYVSKLGEDDFFLTLVPYVKLNAVLRTVFSEDEFLSPYGIRSLSKVYQQAPYNFKVEGHTYSISYQPGESESNMFGGNSNWRGPIWLCMNYFFVECMERYAEVNQVLTQPLVIEYPTRADNCKRETFANIAHDLCQRIVNLYTPNQEGSRPSHGNEDKYLDEDWKNLVLFYEYFHGDTGRGCGASHQTGWSALYLEFVRKLSAFETGGKWDKALNA